MFEDIKLLLGPAAEGKDEIIQLLINLATDDAVSKTGCKDVLVLSSVITEMVIFKFNRLGTEGLNSESYSGISYNYSSDYPDSILSALSAIKKSQLGMGSFKILW